MNQQVCDPDKLSLFVRGELSEQAERDLASHLDECESCGQALEQQVAEAAAWREASVFLGESVAQEEQADFCITQSHDAQIEQALAQLGPTDDPDSLGRIGGYEVTGAIGSGGMGVVLKAHDHSLDRVVAVKVMAPHLAASGSARQRFAREAKAAAAVLHPNVIAIHGVSNEQALPYLVMPYVRGQSLQKRIDTEGPLPLVDILRIGAQIAAGLAAAHEQGLVHRDIKPGNILMEQGVERVTITDFGLARAVDDASMTRSGVIAGTPQYMSPEQARGEPIDARSDLFSLGSLLYAMCTGHSPFRAETSFGVMHRIMQESPRPITEINSEIPVWLEDIVRKLLSKAAGDRFETAGGVAELLEGCLSHIQNPITTPLPKLLTELAAKPSGHRRWTKYIAASVLLPLFLLAGVLIRLELNKGTLRIESEVDDVPIRIVQGKDVVEELTVSKSGKSVRIAAGNYQCEIGGQIDGITVDDGSVTLQRGGNDVVRIISVSPVTSALGSDGKSTVSQSSISLRRETVDNLNRIINALHRYHELQGRFPTATILGKDGKGGPPHSWRVELLPLLGHQELYDQYHFDEPWESEHNKGLIAKMPDVYRSPLDKADSPNTSYFGVVSDDVSRRAVELQQMRDHRGGVLEPEYEQYTPEATVFWKQRGASFIDMLDGTSNCIAVIEAKREIPWTKPADIGYSADQPLPKFGGWFEQGLHAAFADGTVRFLANYNDEQTIRNLLTISDGQFVEPLLVRRLRIHGAVEIPEDEPEVAVGPATYQVPGGPLLMIQSDKKSVLTEADIIEVTATPDPNNPSVGDIVTITLTEEAGKRFLEATTWLSEQDVNGYMVIMFDGKILSAPRVITPIGNKLTITGNIDAKALAEQIQAAMDEVDAPQKPASAEAELEGVKPVQAVPQEEGEFVRIPLKVEWHSARAMEQILSQRHLTILADGVMKEDDHSNAVNRVLRSVLQDCRLDSYKLVARDGADYWDARLFVPRKPEYLIGSLWYSDPIRTLRIGDRHTPVPADTLTQDEPQAKLDAELKNGFQLRLDNSTMGEPRLSSAGASQDNRSAKFESRITGQFGFLTAKQVVSVNDAVAAFNRMARQSEVGRKQQELTTDEVVASLRNWIDQNKGNAGTRKELQEIIDTQTFQPGHQLSYSSRYISEGNVFDVWEIKFGDKGSVPWLRIRDVLLGSRPKTPHEQELWEQIRVETAKNFDNLRLGGLGASQQRSSEEQSRLGQLLDQAYQPPADISDTRSPADKAAIHKFRPYRATRRSQVEERIHETLQQPTVKSIKKSTLDDILRQFANFHEVKIIFDPVWLEHAAPDRDQPFTVELGDLTLEEALDFILEPRGMSYFVRQDEIRITSLEIAASYQYERFYALPPLLKGQEEKVIETLTTKVTPDKWWLSGGDYVASATDGWLTISANRSVHEAASKLLKELQESREQQPLTKPATEGE